MNPTRRDFIQATVSATLLTAALGSESKAAEAPEIAGSSFTYQHAPVALPYAANSLNGLSEQLIQSHWQNNYGGSVAALNVVRSKLEQTINDTNTPAYLYNALKREQLLRTSSVVLHELYFANLGGNGNPAAEIRSRISASFGSFDAWENEFRKIGLGLGGGSGWVMLGYNHSLKLLENYWMADHATAPAHTTPLLVMDMYEHSYQMDFGSAAARYVDAFFNNINWETVSSRS